MTAFGRPMPDNTEEWKRMCAQAANEQDPEKLVILTQRIIELLDQRIREARDSSEPQDLKT
jgi:DnaJ-domain-containing protein 1